MSESVLRNLTRRGLMKIATSAAVLTSIRRTAPDTCAEAAKAIARPGALSPNTVANDYPKIASGDPNTPEFHGPRVVGATPDRDFLFKVPYTGTAPVAITAIGLPDSLTMDFNGLITGRINQAGEYNIQLTAKNALGTARRVLRLVVGEHKLALTPPMGWNSWNA